MFESVLAIVGIVLGAILGVLAFAGLIMVAFADVISRWRIWRLEVAPAASPELVLNDPITPSQAATLAASAKDAFVASQKLLPRGGTDMAWIGHTTVWSVQFGILAIIVAWLAEAPIVTALLIGVAFIFGGAILLALKGLFLTAMALPGLQDTEHSLSVALTGIDHLARAQAILHRLGAEVDDVVAFRNPIQGASIIWVILPRFIFNFYAFAKMKGELRRWEELADQAAAAATKLGAESAAA